MAFHDEWDDATDKPETAHQITEVSPENSFSISIHLANAIVYTRKRMTFVNTTAIAYGQRIGRSLMILVVCNSSCVHKRHAFASTISCTEHPSEFAERLLSMPQAFQPQVSIPSHRLFLTYD